MSRSILALVVVALASSPASAGTPTLAEVHTASARSAAARGDCDTVAYLGAKVRALDPDYYRATFVVDVDIVGCGEVAEAAPAPAPVRPPSSVVVAEVASAPASGTRRTYLGWMIGLDVAAVLGMGVAIESEQGALFGVSLLAWALGPAIVHSGNGNGPQAGYSFLRRLLLPPAGALAGGLIASAGDCQYECWEILIGGALGGLVGMGVATVWDWGRSYVDVPARVIQPIASADADRVTVGLAGAF